MDMSEIHFGNIKLTIEKYIYLGKIILFPDESSRYTELDNFVKKKLL